MSILPRPITLACAMTLGILGGMPVAQAETLPVAGAATSTALSGTVTIVDLDRRMLTIKTPEGRFEVLHVPAAVQRLDQVKIGNQLTVTQTELVLVDLQKGADVGTVGVTTQSGVMRDPGNKPAGTLVESLTVTGIVEAVDTAKSTVTIKGPENRMTFKVEDPAVLASVARGDTVSASYIRAISGEVTFR